MTLSDALAGFAGSITSRGDVPENPNTPHYHFIHSTLIPLTGKLQKELRGRKFKVRFFICPFNFFFCVCIAFVRVLFCFVLLTTAYLSLRLGILRAKNNL